MALFTFYQIFRVLDDKTLAFIHKTKVGDLEFEAGAQLSKGVIIAGIDFFKYVGKNMEANQSPNGTYEITKVYVA